MAKKSRAPKEPPVSFLPKDDDEVKVDRARALMRNIFGTYEDLSVERQEGTGFLSILVNMGEGKVYRVQFESIPLMDAPEWSH